MRMSPSGQLFIIGKGWRVGPMTPQNAGAVIERVIAMLQWSAKTKKQGGE